MSYLKNHRPFCLRAAASDAKNHWQFGLRAAAADTLEIDVYDVIGESWWSDGVTAKSVLAKLKAAQGIRKVNLRINSGGGDVYDGTAIYNLLRSHDARVIVDVDGLAASMASIIVQAGDRRRMAENALMMIHNPWMFTLGEAKDLRHDAEMLDKTADAMSLVYSKRSGQPIGRIRELMDAETWMTAAEALELGLVDEVTPAKSKAAASLRSVIDLGRFTQDRVPEAARALAVASAPPKTVTNPTPDAPPAPIENPAPAPEAARTEPEQTTMKFPQALLTALNVSADADEAAVIAAADRGRTALAQVVTLTASVNALLAELNGTPEANGQPATPGLRKRCADAEDAVIEALVDAQVGKKITPAEKPDFVQLAKTNRKLFDSMIANRTDLGIVGERRAVDPHAPPPAVGGGADAGSDLAAAAERPAAN